MKKFILKLYSLNVEHSSLNDIIYAQSGRVYPGSEIAENIEGIELAYIFDLRDEHTNVQKKFIIQRCLDFLILIQKFNIKLYYLQITKEMDIIREHSEELYHYVKNNCIPARIPQEVSREELLNRFKDYMTVADFKKSIERYGIKDTAKVVVQRVEDFYYENNNWGVYLQEGDAYWQMKNSNEQGNGEYVKKLTEEELHYFKDQYHPVWCVVGYKDQDIVCLDLHY